MPPSPKEINERLERIESAIRWISLRLAASRGESVEEDLNAILDGRASITEEGRLTYKSQDEPRSEAPSPADTRARQQEENLEERPEALRPPAEDQE